MLREKWDNVETVLLGPENYNMSTAKESAMKETAYNPKLVDAGLLLARIMLAVVFVFHGSQKLFAAFGGPGIQGFAGFLGQLGVPLPTVSAYLAGGAEFFGGLLLLAGAFTRLATVPMIFTMLVASFAVHGNAFSIQQGGMEYALTLAVFLLVLCLTGAGRVSVDNAILSRKSGTAAAAKSHVTAAARC
jgi:putative oxidoreductase